MSTGSQVAERWEEDLDELEPEDWEFHFGGPEDRILEEIENEEDEIEMVADQTEFESEEDESEEDWDEEFEERCPKFENGGPMSMKVASNRQVEIFEWIRSSELGRPVDRQLGTFEIPSSILIKLKNGIISDVGTWLSREGFNDGLILDQYSVSVSKSETAEEKEVTFIFEKRQIIEVPFEFGDPNEPPF